MLLISLLILALYKCLHYTAFAVSTIYMPMACGSSRKVHVESISVMFVCVFPNWAALQFVRRAFAFFRFCRFGLQTSCDSVLYGSLHRVMKVTNHLILKYFIVCARTIIKDFLWEQHQVNWKLVQKLLLGAMSSNLIERLLKWLLTLLVIWAVFANWGVFVFNYI